MATEIYCSKLLGKTRAINKKGGRNMKSFWRTKLNYLLVSSFLLFIGCATWLLGPVYSKVDKIPDDAGLVYFYRPFAFGGGGLAYDVKTGDTLITTLYNGGYYPYFSSPGEKEFWAETESISSVTLDIKPGQTYYIKGEVGVGFMLWRPHLMVVAPEIAEKEIADCKLIP
jgi:hypothetical protein